MIALITALWEKSGLVFKFLVLALVGPAYGVYLLLGARDAFKVEILNATDKQWEDKAAPYIAKREVQFQSIDARLDSMDKKLDILIYRK